VEYILKIKKKKWYCLIHKHEDTTVFKTCGTTHMMTQCHDLEDLNPRHHCENLKFCFIRVIK